jgi:transaldolase
LNEEVQKGVYDELIQQSRKLLESLDEGAHVREVALILNARHGLRLVERFGCPVSVELHTDVADNCEATIAYTRRLHAICPDRFIVKVPLTPAGLIATRALRGAGIPVNLTLGFSARQNYVATALASPSYVNVFLGRLNSFIADNQLGDGQWVGEKTTLASQHEVQVFTLALPQTETRQIAASIRDPAQLSHLAGVDVMTIPPKVAEEAQRTLDGEWESRREEQYAVSLTPEADAEAIRLDTLWSVRDETRKCIEQLILHPPKTAGELIQAMHDNGTKDLFPQLTEEELARVAANGKIPKYCDWGDKIMRQEVAIDSLMTCAGIAHFAKSQAALDERVRKHL